MPHEDIAINQYNIAEIARRLVQSPCLSFRRSFFFVVVDKAIGHVINDLIKRRASPRSKYNDQHPLVKRPKYASTKVSAED